MRRLIEDGIAQILCVDLRAPDTGSLPSILSRRQFPVFSAFAMTINNDQGQTMRRISLCLPTLVFSRGQLHVALSRVSSPLDMKIFIPQLLP